MTDILSIIQGSNAHVRLEVSGEDLLAFSNDLINRAKDELTTIVEESRKERFLSKEEVKQLCGVCDATLWHWGKKNYLKPVRCQIKVHNCKCSYLCCNIILLFSEILLLIEFCFIISLIFLIFSPCPKYTSLGVRLSNDS